jgi:hypothetical protein
MPFTTRIAPDANRQTNSWGLAEPTWIEVLLHLYQTLTSDLRLLVVEYN